MELYLTVFVKRIYTIVISFSVAHSIQWRCQHPSFQSMCTICLILFLRYPFYLFYNFSFLNNFLLSFFCFSFSSTFSLEHSRWSNVYNSMIYHLVLLKRQLIFVSPCVLPSLPPCNLFFFFMSTPSPPQSYF